MIPKSFAFVTLASLLLAPACIPPGALDEQAHGGRDISLRFEGTCEHLACCSAYAVPVADATPGAFGCTGSTNAYCSQNRGWFAPAFTCNPLLPGRYRQPDDPPFLACNDLERWLSLPNLKHPQCGESFLVCRGGVRVIAYARDRSAPNGSGNMHVEGSLGLLQALGADPGAQETIVSVYSLEERDRIAADPQCVGEERRL
jgi:hypothetical protein